MMYVRKLTIPTEYFDDEVRDGFYVNGMMKRAWAAQLEILADFDELCTKYGLRYMADWGTLIGAVRYGGFIPWDDDFDVGMPRADYRRFCEVVSELGGDYQLLNGINRSDYVELFGRLVSSHAICLDPSYIDKFHGVPFTLGIDIFVYDYLYRDDEKEDNRQALIESVYALTSRIRDHGEVSPEDRKNLLELEELTGYDFLSADDTVCELVRYMDEVLSECPEAESDYIADYQNYLKSHRRYKLPRDTFDRLIALDYEFMQIPVPAVYDQVLRIKFGDYLKVVKSWTSHDYPYYGFQMDILREHKPEYYPRYVYSPTMFNRSDGQAKEEYKALLTKPVKQEKARTVSGDKSTDNGIKGDVLFLPYKYKYWESMRPFWEEAKDNPDCRVYVMPIPYYEKNWDGSHGTLRYEKSLFPPEIGAIELDGFDLSALRPGTIVFQDPRDDYADTMSVHPMFYSDRLKGLTDDLILIPPLEPDVPDEQDAKGWLSMDHFVTMPGVLNADKVYVSSDAMRQAYIRKLKDFCGVESPDETDDIAAIRKIENKIRVAPWVKKECEKDIPEDWATKLIKPDGTHKKVILYEINASATASYGNRMIDKIRRVFSLFMENMDNITVILRVAPDLETVCGVMSEQDQGKLLDVLEEYVAAGFGIFDPSPDPTHALEAADAYYGDATDLVRRFIRAGKPVMIENPEV